jgi:hypothetical protein
MLSRQLAPRSRGGAPIGVEDPTELMLRPLPRPRPGPLPSLSPLVPASAHRHVEGAPPPPAAGALRGSSVGSPADAPGTPCRQSDGDAALEVASDAEAALVDALVAQAPQEEGSVALADSHWLSGSAGSVNSPAANASTVETALVGEFMDLTREDYLAVVRRKQTGTEIGWFESVRPLCCVFLQAVDELGYARVRGQGPCVTAVCPC